MRLKVVLTGLLLSLLVTLPVLAISARNTQRSRALSVIFWDDGGTPTGTFANWNVQPTSWTLCFGNGTGYDGFLVEGLRIDAAARQWAKSFSFDVKSTTDEVPFIEVWVNFPHTTSPDLAFDADLPDFANISGFTLKSLHNGFTRVSFNASQSDLPKGSTFSSIYYADFSEGTNESFTDKITNVFVNELPVGPNVQPTPEFDSTLDF